MSSPLGLTQKVLKTLVVLNVLYGIGILLGLVVSVVNPAWFMEALKINSVLAPRLIMVAGLVSIPINHTILSRLRTIVDTVGAGDPFVVENARRLQAIAWSVLALETIHILIGTIASSAALDLDLDYSLTPWIAVLLIFVLARVFDHGARMRADLEGTV
jgi:hypothetical protein